MKCSTWLIPVSFASLRTCTVQWNIPRRERSRTRLTEHRSHSSTRMNARAECRPHDDRDCNRLTIQRLQTMQSNARQRELMWILSKWLQFRLHVRKCQFQCNAHLSVNCNIQLHNYIEIPNWMLYGLYPSVCITMHPWMQYLPEYIARPIWMSWPSSYNCNAHLNGP